MLPECAYDFISHVSRKDFAKFLSVPGCVFNDNRVLIEVDQVDLVQVRIGIAAICQHNKINPHANAAHWCSMKVVAL